MVTPERISTLRARYDECHREFQVEFRHGEYGAGWRIHEWRIEAETRWPGLGQLFWFFRCLDWARQHSERAVRIIAKKEAAEASEAADL